MATCTLTLKIDLDGDGLPETDISAYWLRPRGFSLATLGRVKDHDSAGASKVKLILDNLDGRFGPENAAGAYYPTFDTALRVAIVATFNAVPYDQWAGRIEEVKLDTSRDNPVAILSCIDEMATLSQAVITVPLMEDVASHTLVNRALDHAEGELCRNPRFKDDLTGYAIWGSSTNTRVITGRVMEGLAAMETVAAIAAGWKYTIPHDADADFQGKRVTVGTYLWTPNAADVGEVVRLRLADSVDSSIAFTDLTLTERPQRVKVSGVFEGAATDFYVQTYTIATAATYRTGALHIAYGSKAMPYDGARLIDEGKAIFERVARYEDDALSVIQRARDNELGALFYVDEAGVPRFENRHHRYENTDHLSSVLTLEDKWINLGYTRNIKDRLSGVILYFPRWDVGTAGEVVAAALPMPRSLPPSVDVAVNFDYQGATVRDEIKPVANTDYVINSAPDGSGSDLSGSVTLEWETFGGGSRAVLNNGGSVMAYLISFVVRGTPVRASSDATPVRVTAPDGPDEENVLRKIYNLNASEADIQGWGEFLAYRYGPQRTRLEIDLDAPFPEAAVTSLLPQILGRKVSDRITITNDAQPWQSALDGDFYIESKSVSFTDGPVKATWRLSPKEPPDAPNYFRLNNSKLAGGALEYDVLAP